MLELDPAGVEECGRGGGHSLVMSLRVLITGSTPGLGLAFQFVQLAVWLRGQGLDVVMTGCDGEATPGLFESLRQSGVSFHDVPGLRKTGVPELLRPAGDLRDLMKKLRPDVAIITAVGHLAETRGVDRRHTSVVWWLQSVRNTTRYAGLARRLAAWTVNRSADQAWVQCELERRFMTRYGMREDFTRLVPTPVDVQWWRSRAAEPLSAEFAEVAKAKAMGRPILVYPASLLPAKRHDTLFRAAAIVKKQFPHLFVCCPGRFSAEPLWPLVRALQLQDSVLFTESFVRQEAIPPLLGAADVHVFPSEGETYGKALIEAWCIGTPTVSTRVGVAYESELAGVAKVVEVGNHEHMARSILEILGDPEVARDMRSKSIRWIDENYSFEAVGQKIIGLMEDLTAHRHGRRRST